MEESIRNTVIDMRNNIETMIGRSLEMFIIKDFIKEEWINTMIYKIKIKILTIKVHISLQEVKL